MDKIFAGKPPDDYIRPLRAGVLFWSSYYLVIAIMDWLIAAPAPLPASYVLYFGSSIILLPVLAFWPYPAKRLGRAYPVLILILMGFLPLLGEAVVLPNAGVQPWLEVRASSTAYVRQWLPNVVVVVLIAYCYRWFHVVLFVGILVVLNLLLAAARYPFDMLLTPAVIALFGASLMLILGLGISLTVERQRRQQRELHGANLRLLELSDTVEELAISRERNRLARDLHDTLAHSLTGLIIQLETADAYSDVDPTVARARLADALQTARTGLQETRRALAALRAGPLEDLGLAPALKQLAEAAAEQAGASLYLRLPASVPALDQQIERCIYRVAQEALANVVQHAGATQLLLRLACSYGRITLTMSDDGVGFDQARVTHPGHYGIPGMEERAQLAGGSLKITTAPGEGTVVLLDLPIKGR